MDKFKESVNNIITNQYAKVDKKPKKQLQSLSLQVKDISSKQSESDKLLNEHLWENDKQQQN